MNTSDTNSAFKAGLFSAILFLFFIQQLTFLVESIYMLNLLNTKMDIRVAGMLLLALPGLLFFVNHSKRSYLIIIILILICMWVSPMLPSPMRIYSSGLGAGLFLLYLGLQLSDRDFPKVNWGQSAALATLISILFRALGDTQDISVTGNTKLIGIFLILFASYLRYSTVQKYPDQRNSSDGLQESEDEKNSKGAVWASVLGLAGSFILIYFVYSSPGVIARWIEGNYNLIHIVLLISILIVVFFASRKIMSLKNQKLILMIWNGFFLIIFIWNILLHRVTFPSLAKLTPVIVGGGDMLQTVVNYSMLILSPVIFINISWFTRSIKPSKPFKLALPFLAGVGLIIICIFILIFTNTWGYVGDLSMVFRNQFYVPFAIAGLCTILPYFFSKVSFPDIEEIYFPGILSKLIAVLLVVVSCGFMLIGNGGKMPISNENINELTLMTYNIQQGVDLFGDKNFKGQLSMIKEIDPDILCLQESDAARISGGNSDVVRYFSEKLGYYSYYGPKTIAGTYGTAILSKFPLEDCRTIFTYSSKDEIGTAVAEISVDNHRITIINSHPAGDATSREEHINMVISLAEEKEIVIAMGDYNFRQDSPYYKKVTRSLKNAWTSLYPDAIGTIDIEKIDLSIRERKTSSGKLLPNGKIDMTERIDHIFLSESLDVREAHYIPAPESETDHPLHWAVVSWDN